MDQTQVILYDKTVPELCEYSGQVRQDNLVYWPAGADKWYFLREVAASSIPTEYTAVSHVTDDGAVVVRCSGLRTVRPFSGSAAKPCQNHATSSQLASKRKKSSQKFGTVKKYDMAFVELFITVQIYTLVASIPVDAVPV